MIKNGLKYFYKIYKGIMLPKITIPSIKKEPPKIYPSYEFKLNFDGCSKGNPGLAGAGAVIYKDNKEYWFDFMFIGENNSNNYAEYSGLIIGLKKAKECGIKSILVEGDSLLVINQMKGLYKCKSDNLIHLYNLAKELEKSFDHIEYNHVMRNMNKRADYLSNLAIKDYEK